MTSGRAGLPLAVTMGDPAGIGGEITCKAWTARHQQALPPFFLIDDPDRIAALARASKFDVPVRAIAHASEAAAAFATALPVQDSSMLGLLSRADGLIRRPPDAPAAQAGAWASVIPLD